MRKQRIKFELDSPLPKEAQDDILNILNNAGAENINIFFEDSNG